MLYKGPIGASTSPVLQLNIGEQQPLDLVTNSSPSSYIHFDFKFIAARPRLSHTRKLIEGTSGTFIDRTCLPLFSPFTSPSYLVPFIASTMETFENIYLDLSKQSGRCRIAESGLGWKPSGGETFTLDSANIGAAQWSRAARGYEMKILSRSSGVIQLDGFEQEVKRL